MKIIRGLLWHVQPLTWVAAAIGAAGALLGSAKSASESTGHSKYQLDYQRDLANTAHRRQMEDMRQAGLNPVLSAKLGGAGNVSPVGAQIPDYGKAASTAINAARAEAEVEQRDSTIRNLDQQTKTGKQEENLKRADVLHREAQIEKTRAETDAVRAGIGRMEYQNALDQVRTTAGRLGFAKLEAEEVVFDAMGEFIIVYKETGSITAALAAAYGVVKNARRKGSGKK